MSRLAHALIAVLRDFSAQDAGDLIGEPKRTVERWLAQLREDYDLRSWSGASLEKLAHWEARNAGTQLIADAFRPVGAKTHMALEQGPTVQQAMDLLRQMTAAIGEGVRLQALLQETVSQRSLASRDTRALMAATELVLSEMGRAMEELQRLQKTLLHRSATESRDGR